MMIKIAYKLLILLSVLMAPPVTASENERVSMDHIERTISGVSFTYQDDHHIRTLVLSGVRSPVPNQICLNENELTYNCGRQAHAVFEGVLRQYLSGGMTCDLDLARSDRLATLGTCYDANGDDIALDLISSGYAVPFRVAEDHGYVAASLQAERSGAGLWAGSFKFPWEYTHIDDKDKRFIEPYLPTRMTPGSFGIKK